MSTEKSEVRPHEHAGQTFNHFNSIPRLNIDVKNNNAAEWKKWWQCLELFLLATNLENASEKRKIAIMLHAIGERGLEIYNYFNMDMETITLQQAKQKFETYFEPQKNLTVIRHFFFTRVQKSDESVDTFLRDLET